MAEDPVINEIESPERELELPPPDTVGTALAVIDDRPDEAVATTETNTPAAEPNHVQTPPQ